MCYVVVSGVTQEARLPNDNSGSTHVSLRVPNDLIEAFDKLAAMLDRPRSWVMLRALRQYLEDEGAEIAEDAESLAELDRGERVPFEESIREVREIIGRTEKKRPNRR
jgi:predicted transcriptional regulator